MRAVCIRTMCILLLAITCLTACSPYPPDVAWETEAPNSMPSRVIRQRGEPIDKAALVGSDFLPDTTPSETTPETQPVPEAAPPDTQAPAASTTPEGSTMTRELAEALAGQAYYWAPSGTKIHTTPACSALREVIYAGTLAEAEAVKDGGFCKKCKSPDQTVEAILGCYSYEDYRKS